MRIETNHSQPVTVPFNPVAQSPRPTPSSLSSCKGDNKGSWGTTFQRFFCSIWTFLKRIFCCGCAPVVRYTNIGDRLQFDGYDKPWYSSGGSLKEGLIEVLTFEKMKEFEASNLWLARELFREGLLTSSKIKVKYNPSSNWGLDFVIHGVRLFNDLTGAANDARTRILDTLGIPPDGKNLPENFSVAEEKEISLSDLLTVIVAIPFVAPLGALLDPPGVFKLPETTEES